MSRLRWSTLFARKPRLSGNCRPKTRLAVESLEERTLLTAGALDATFGLNGLVATDFHAVGKAVAVEPNGQIVVAGYATDPTTGSFDFALVRYNGNGSLDNTFGNNGEVLTDFSTLLGQGDAFGKSVAVQSDGRIVVGGYAFDNSGGANSGFYDFALARYNVNGTLDNSFGRNGRVVTDFTSVVGSGTDEVNALTLQSDGKIVVAGVAFDPANSVGDFAVARFNQDGNPDTTFGPNNNGLVTTNISGTAGFGLSNSAANAVVLQGNGDIVAAGYGFDPTKGGDDFALARYTPSGRLDGTFNTNGVVLTNFGTGNPEGDDVANGVALSGNQIVAAGYATPDNSNPSGQRFAVARYTTFGQLDTSFAGTGKITTQINDDDVAHAVAVQSDGKIVAAGSTFTAGPATYAFAVVRYNTDGSLDGNFNPTGILPGVAITSFFQTPKDDQANAVALQPDGRIVAAGFAYEPNGDYAFGVARYLAATGTVQISAPAPVLEGATATITITRSDTSGAASVTFSTSDGTAHAGTDYNAITQTVVFAPGQGSATVNAPTLDDNTAGDSARTVNLTLSNPSGMILGSPSTAVLTIGEPAPVSQVQFALPGDSTPEASGSTKTVTITRSGDTSQAASVTVSVVGGSAAQGRDFQIANPTVQFAAGQAQATAGVTILNDGAVDGNETISLALLNPSGASLGSQSTFTLTIDETNVSPPPPPPPHRTVFAELVPVRMGRKNKWLVEVLYADTGALKAEFLSPFQQPAFRNVQVSAVPGDGAGVPDQVILMGQRKGRLVSLDIPV